MNVEVTVILLPRSRGRCRGLELGGVVRLAVALADVLPARVERVTAAAYPLGSALVVRLRPRHP